MLRRVLSFKGKACGLPDKLCGWMGVVANKSDNIEQ